MCQKIKSVTALLLILITTCVYGQDKCLFAVDIIRHGTRAPLQALPNAQYTAETPLGELTSEGIKETIQMGARFRQKYVNDYQLLPESYDPTLVYVRASSIERAIKTAESFLAGFYPNEETVRHTLLEATAKTSKAGIPINIFPPEQDGLIPCQTQPEQKKALREKYEKDDPFWQAKEKALAEDFKVWEKATGYKIPNLYAVGRLADTLMVYQQLNVPLPETLTSEQLEAILALRDEVYLKASQLYPMSCSLGLPLIQNIESFLVDGFYGYTPLKYAVLSGHDTSILNTAGALGANLPYFPRYNATLSFRVIEDDLKNRTVQVFYDDKPLAIQGCDGHVCELAQFRSVIRRAESHAEPVCH